MAGRVLPENGMVGADVKFDRIRRITGYLVGTTGSTMKRERRSGIVINTAFPKELRIAGTIQDSIVDGPGIRYVIFTQGCPHHCPGCHNPQTHDFAGGHIADVEQILESIRQNPLLSGVTFSGGEPFCQAEALVPVAEAVKAMHKHLMIYTGYLYEQLLKMEEPGVQRLLELADVLVDGPFLMAERNLTLQYRGSENQRVIDLAKTRAAGEIILYKSEYDEL